MSKRKTADASATEAAIETTEPVEAAAPDERQAADEQPYAPITAPPKGHKAAITIDNRLGYRKEDSADGKRRQIRFADRESAAGSRPDDETLAPVREEKPHVSWTGKEKSWQARKTPEGLEAIDSADQKLAELGRKRRDEGGRDR
jgi:hypothetical protein